MSAAAPVARILSTGLFTPPHRVSNEELVEAYNAWAERWNANHPDNQKPLSSAEFIEKASGIKSRFVLDKVGMLDIDRMRPSLPTRSNEELSIMAEIAVAAAKEAMEAADLGPQDIDAVLCAASNMQRPYPAMAVEIQNALGIEGYGFDMNVACASAAFGIQTAIGLLSTGARRVLMVNPEICTGHINFRDRDGHFIFGDVATAVILGHPEEDGAWNAFDVLDTRLKTVFSNNIRNNMGFLDPSTDKIIEWDDPETDRLFKQNGRSVFKEVIPMVAEMICQHLDDNDIATAAIKRLWLHQANLNMNVLIAKKVLGREATPEENPTVLDEYANTSSAGSIIAFHKHRDGLAAGDIGVVSGFGAGYSAGSIIVRKS
ncbi:3-oxoacyl-(acyl carrier protein) synthase [Parvularcula bermudensis HTCC2503]|uniref:3-oxoacyl-(Acyl carrier protein) synthase n=1 Tax=Parvularcula bermudensis (strain ATCC BAA-594 / HTCC2503 / KCTC 12087) TaxID=314260 RepID=E0TCJ6_PARBH|nr:beta-ketoacyl-ACP synthase III [Parvularcula bermudensis]ADM08585.1 3-oxoacyl-(acyl carrier protein) synthase [Parvularcula bermudensis HTCC2503]